MNDPFTTDKPQCDGTTLVVCNAGKRERLDCKSLGFAGCNARFGVCSSSVYPE
ncbi:MAG: hypothetical protein HYV09_08330 [Deltaproteobacteria bacterium]|nr:hypothetical protein [Deltaproteobacteria bacterium]